jgi:predicted nucleotidyltransferase
MEFRGFEQYFTHEEQVVARRDSHLAIHKERLSQQAAILTDVLSAMGAKRIWVFGSLARGRVRCESDLDMAVQGLPYAQDQLLGIAEKVLQGELALDLVPWEKASPELRDRILEGRLVYEREARAHE